MKKILLTGGGTAGHVTPNIALIPSLLKENYEIRYIGSYDGIEKNLITNENITYFGISSGKFRRYFSLKNFTDPFNVIKGYFEAKKYIKEYSPDVLFSKGGFVSVPVVLAARRNHVPVIIHESDMTPGLANKISIPFSKKICHTFLETKDKLPKKKAVYTGSPIRSDLLEGNKDNAFKITGFTNTRPILFVTGGSLGSVAINNALKDSLDELLKSYQIIHICGKGKTDSKLNNIPGYKQFEYVSEEYKDLISISDLVISRAGSNSINEFLLLNKPNILIPLSAKASRGDQILNAASFEKQGFSYVILEENLNSNELVLAIDNVYKNRSTYIETMKNSGNTDSISIIIDLIKSF